MAADTPPTNIRIIAPSRKRLKAGDVFAIQPADLGFLFGRVIDPETPRFGFPLPVVLAYIYEPLFPTMRPPPGSALSRDRLLIPPFGTNRLPWSRGYFHTVDHRRLESGDILPRHVFDRPRTDPERRGEHRFLDIEGNEVTPGDEPIGWWGLHSVLTIDDEISRAIGLPVVPADE